MSGGPASPPIASSPPRHRSNTLNAVSFGFIATAVLFAMFLVMAIFERLLRPHRPFLFRTPRPEELPRAPAAVRKPEVENETTYSNEVSVVMPGQDFPTYFALPVPPSTAPERVPWPSHAESSGHSFSVWLSPDCHMNSTLVDEKAGQWRKEQLHRNNSIPAMSVLIWGLSLHAKLRSDGRLE